MRIALAIALLALAWQQSAFAADGLVTQKSAHGVAETIDRLVKAAEDKGLTVFLRLDHAAGAAKVGTALRPTELLVFGNPKGGTPLLQCAQSIGIDLPLKALAWEDQSGAVWLGYNEPTYLAARHELGSACSSAIDGAAKLLQAISSEAVRN